MTTHWLPSTAHAACRYTPAPAPAYGFPAFLGLLLASYALFFIGDAILTVGCTRGSTLSRTAWRCGVAGSCIGVIASVLLVLAYFIGFRVDGGMWSLVLLTAVLLNLYVTVRRAVSSGGHANDGVDVDWPTPSTERASSAAARCLALRSYCAQPAPRRCAPLISRGASRARCTADVMHGVARWTALTLVIAQLGGAWLQAAGYRKYPPRGNFYDVEVSGHAGTQRLHAYCTGPVNASRPTIWLEIGGGGHSSTDFLDVQDGLNAASWRTCTYDPPGCGWSGYFVTALPMQLTAQLMAAMGEPGPFIILGDMDDGAERAYSYALAYPDTVRAVIALQYGGSGEFTTLASFYGWSADETKRQAVNTLKGRLALGDLIRGLAVQWGVIAALVPQATANASATENEKLFLNILNEKQWSMQCQILAAQIADPASTVLQPSLWQRNRSLAPAIPVFALENQRPVVAVCNDAGYAVGSDDCNLVNYTAAVGHAFMVNMTTMSAGSRLFSLPGGSDDWLGSGNTRNWVTATILTAISGIVA